MATLATHRWAWASQGEADVPALDARCSAPARLATSAIYLPGFRRRRGGTALTCISTAGLGGESIG